MAEKGTHSYVADRRNDSILIFINGEIVPRSNAKISVFDSGFLLGDGVWEGIRLHNGHLCFQGEHFDRLFHGAEKLKIDIGKSRNELIKIVKNTLLENKMEPVDDLLVLLDSGCSNLILLVSLDSVCFICFNLILIVLLDLACFACFYLILLVLA